MKFLPFIFYRRLEVFHIYIYPNDLKAKPTLWLWALRDVAVTGVCLVLSVLALVELGLVLVWQKKLCKSRDTAVKGTGANQGLALAGHRLAYPPMFRDGRRYARAA